MTDDLPLTPRVFLILWALQGEPKHGYRLLQDIEQLGQGSVGIGPASLYEAIQTLRKRGWIEPADAPVGVDSNDRRRRYFRLTDGGEAMLRAEAERLEALVGDLRTAGVLRQAQ